MKLIDQWQASGFDHRVVIRIEFPRYEYRDVGLTEDGDWRSRPLRDDPHLLERLAFLKRRVKELEEKE